MIIVDVEQGSHEWFQARMGIPTASRFGDILTPRGKLSASSIAYVYELLAEWLTGKPKPQFLNDAMLHGTLTQPEAAAYYEMRTGRDVETVGFCLHDSGRFGASPDSLVGEDGLLEIKCQQQNTHMETLVTEIVPAKYVPQVQGQLLVTGREWADFVAYHPELPGVIIRVNRDEEYIALLHEALGSLCDQLDAGKENLRSRGFYPATAPTESGMGSNGAPSEAAESD